MAEYEKKVREVLKKHGCYFVRHGKGDHDIWYSPITDTIENVEDIGLFSPYFDELLDKFNKGKILFIEANQSSSRIIMQQGLFMFPYNLDKKKHKDILVNNTHLLKIHKSTRTVLLNFLENIGIDSFRLMPDLQNVCYAIKRKIIEEKRTLLQL